MAAPSASATLTPHSGQANRKLVVPSSGSTIQVRVVSVPPTVPPSSPRKAYAGRALASSSRTVRSASSSAMETRSAGPLLARTASSESCPNRCCRPSPAACAAAIIACRSEEASIMCPVLRSIPEPGVPQAGGEQHRQHRRADPEPDHRSEVIAAYVASQGHALLDQLAGDVFLDAGADVAEDADHAHRR